MCGKHDFITNWVGCLLQNGYLRVYYKSGRCYYKTGTYYKTGRCFITKLVAWFITKWVGLYYISGTYYKLGRFLLQNWHLLQNG